MPLNDMYTYCKIIFLATTLALTISNFYLINRLETIKIEDD